MNPGDDPHSTMCGAEIDGTAMSGEDVKTFCGLLLAAGGGTTAETLCHAPPVSPRSIPSASGRYGWPGASTVRTRSGRRRDRTISPGSGWLTL